jgi:hypothetical protein
MSMELIKKTIDGHEYEFQKFGAKPALRMLLRLSKIVGKPLALAVSAAKGEGNLLDRQVDTNVLAMAVEALTNQFDENEVLDIIEELTARDNLLCDGKKVLFNTHYEGRLDHLFKVLAAQLEVQYGNFFGAVLGLRGLQPRAADTKPA